MQSWRRRVGQPYLARIQSYTPNSGNLTELFRFAPARFGDLTPPPTPPFTIDEEGSGVIEITRIVKAAPWFTPNRRYYLGTAQAHAAWSITTGTRAPHT